jgi:hypothetical protein
MVWECFAGDTVWDLFRIQGTQPAWLPQHSDSDTPSHLVCALWDYHLFFNRTMTQHTSRLFKGYLTKKENDGVLHQTTCPPQSPNLNPMEMVWDELEKRPTSAQHNSFKTVGKAFQVKLVERISRVCKTVKAKHGYFE